MCNPSLSTPKFDWLLEFFASLPLHHDFTTPLVDQVNQWATYASAVVPHPADETLTTWWIGINDTGDTVGNASVIPTLA